MGIPSAKRPPIPGSLGEGPELPPGAPDRLGEDPDDGGPDWGWFRLELPPRAGALLSLVTVFLRALPCWIDFKRADLSEPVGVEPPNLGPGPLPKDGGGGAPGGGGGGGITPA